MPLEGEERNEKSKNYQPSSKLPLRRRTLPVNIPPPFALRELTALSSSLSFFLLHRQAAGRAGVKNANTRATICRAIWRAPLRTRETIINIDPQPVEKENGREENRAKRERESEGGKNIEGSYRAEPSWKIDTTAARCVCPPHPPSLVLSLSLFLIYDFSSPRGSGVLLSFLQFADDNAVMIVLIFFLSHAVCVSLCWYTSVREWSMVSLSFSRCRGERDVFCSRLALFVLDFFLVTRAGGRTRLLFRGQINLRDDREDFLLESICREFSVTRRGRKNKAL